MIPAFQRVAVFATAQLRRLTGAIRQHPFRSALALPTLMLLYGLVLLPFEYRSINRQWVALDKIAPHVVNALIATEDHSDPHRAPCGQSAT
jgi:penicillin-binding protein 1A